MSGWDEAIAWLQEIEDRVGNNFPRVLQASGQLLQTRIKQLHGSSRLKANAPITIQGGWMKNKKSGKMFKVDGKGNKPPLINSGNLKEGVTLAPINRLGKFKVETKVYPQNMQIAVWMEYGTYATSPRPAWLIGYIEGATPAYLLMDSMIGAIIG